MKGLYRDIAKHETALHNYTSDPVTLVVGVCEEAGEVGKAVNWYHNPKYIHSPNTNPPDNVEHEIGDLLIYLGALANALDLKIEF